MGAIYIGEDTNNGPAISCQATNLLRLVYLEVKADEEEISKAPKLSIPEEIKRARTRTYKRRHFLLPDTELNENISLTVQKRKRTRKTD